MSAGWAESSNHPLVDSISNQPPSISAFQSHFIKWQKTPFSVSTLRKFYGFQELWAKNCGRPNIYEKYILVIWMTKYIFLINHNIAVVLWASQPSFSPLCSPSVAHHLLTGGLLEFRHHMRSLTAPGSSLKKINKRPHPFSLRSLSESAPHISDCISLAGIVV